MLDRKKKYGYIIKKKFGFSFLRYICKYVDKDMEIESLLLRLLQRFLGLFECSRNTHGLLDDFE